MAQASAVSSKFSFQFDLLQECSGGAIQFMLKNEMVFSAFNFVPSESILGSFVHE